MLHKKAHYNFLRINNDEEIKKKNEPWCFENFRNFSLDELLKRLELLEIDLTKNDFLQLASQLETPEDFYLCFENASCKQKDQIYLLLFELWRRWLPEKPSLSIFCDELDHRIEAYYGGDLQCDEKIQSSLAHLKEIFHENVDQGLDPIEIFQGISEHLAHNLEQFLYSYIFEVLEAGSFLYASELIEMFSPYVRDSSSFEFLYAKLLFKTDFLEAKEFLHKLLKKELKKDLLLKILEFLSRIEERQLFAKAVEKILPFLKTKQELNQVLSMSSEV